MVEAGFRQGFISRLPSFLYETTWLVAIFTAVIFVYLYRSSKSGYFVQLYLLSMVVKLLACFAYNLIMITADRPGAILNVLYFLLVYVLFTAVEIGFLYRKISAP
jgi:predicted membrane channel-forming protein YqfA (hemolysin III family)